MSVKAALFDIDGTLVDSNEFHVLAWEEALRDSGHHISRPAIRAQIGKGADMFLPALLPTVAPSEAKAIAKEHGEIFRNRFLHAVKPFRAATDLIAKVHEAGIKVVLASSAEKKELDYYVGLLNISEYLAASTSFDDVESTKPAGDIFANALKRVAPISAQDALAVGDTPYDIIAAAKCGIRTIALRSGGFSD